MAPSKKKTPKGKKKKQLATSFKKQNLTPTGSGKKFKKMRSAAKLRQNIVGNIRGSCPAESPTTDQKSPPATPSTSAMESSAESPYPVFPTPVSSVGLDLKNLNAYIARRGQDDEFEEVPVQAKVKPTLQDLARKKTPRRKKRVRCEPGPPKGKVLKGDLGDMFR